MSGRGTGIQTTVKELCELILKITGKDYGIRFEPIGETFVTNRVGSTEEEGAFFNRLEACRRAVTLQ
jgi:UDP-glucose 4-epimerase